MRVVRPLVEVGLLAFILLAGPMGPDFQAYEESIPRKHGRHIFNLYLSGGVRGIRTFWWHF